MNDTRLVLKHNQESDFIDPIDYARYRHFLQGKSRSDEP
jgi:hypothetical protein